MKATQSVSWANSKGLEITAEITAITKMSSNEPYNELNVVCTIEDNVIDSLSTRIDDFQAGFSLCSDLPVGAVAKLKKVIVTQKVWEKIDKVQKEVIEKVSNNKECLKYFKIKEKEKQTKFDYKVAENFAVHAGETI